MSSYAGKLCVHLVKEVFGDLVAAVADQLHRWNGQTMQQLLQNKLPKTRESLTVLIHHNLVTFAECPKTGKVVYTLLEDRALCLLRYPRYLVLCKTLFGDLGEVIVEEVFKSGQCSASSVIFKATKRLRLANNDEKDDNVVVVELAKKARDVFADMAACQFLCRVASPYTETAQENVKMTRCPDLKLEEDVFVMPEVDLKAIKEAVERSEEAGDDSGDVVVELFPKGSNNSDNLVLWRINYERFHREFRDQVLVQAVTRRIDASAGNLMRIMLTVMNEAEPWATVSSHIRHNEITDRLLRKTNNNNQVVKDETLREFHEQYVKVLAEDRTRFVDRVGDAGGGQYVVNAKHAFAELAEATADNVVLERFGSKAVRIFRVIRQKVHVEESQLQSLVMIPAKETKHLTYQLLENNFIKLQELRKSLASNSAPSKSFYLYYVDMNQVSRMLVEHCHKTLVNAYVRKNDECGLHQRLLDKHERIESITANLKNSGELEQSEELQLQLQEIQDMLSPVERESVKQIHSRLDQLGRATGQVDETLFVMSTYIFYTHQ